MNAIKSGDAVLSKWAWAAIAAAALIIFSVVMWATSANDEPIAKVDIDRSPQPAKSGAGPTIGYENPPPQTYIPPVPGSMPSTQFQTPLYGGNSGAPVKVKITPQRIMPPLQAPKQTAAKSSVAGKPDLTTRGMFPVGNILKGSSQVPRQDKVPSEVFPSFDYEGRIWQHTGKFASVDQLDIIPTEFEFDGRKVYAFTNSSEPGKVLFVQSIQDPKNYAIYR